MTATALRSIGTGSRCAVPKGNNPVSGKKDLIDTVPESWSASIPMTAGTVGLAPYVRGPKSSPGGCEYNLALNMKPCKQPDNY